MARLPCSCSLQRIATGHTAYKYSLLSGYPVAAHCRALQRIGTGHTAYNYTLQ
jgi:hypothetical protein